MEAIEIPDDLAVQARQIPELQERVIRFIRLEVERHHFSQKRFHPATLGLVAKAKQGAAAKRSSGFDKGQASADLKESWEALGATGGE